MRSRKSLFEQEPEVVSRWVRLKMLSLAPSAGRILVRPRLLLSEYKRTRALRGAFLAVKRQAVRYERGGFDAAKTICNLALHLLIAEQDIAAVKVDALSHPDPWKRNLCLRIMVLTMYEWDYDKIAGTRLRDAMDAVGASSASKNVVNLALRELRAVQQNIGKRFRHVRNAAIGHRDEDPLVQYRAIRDLKQEQVMDLAVEFYEAHNKLTAILPALIVEGGSMPSLLRQRLISARLQGK